MFSRRDLLKYAAAAASFVGPLVARKRTFGYLPSGGVELQPDEQITSGQKCPEPTDEALLKCAINLVVEKTGMFAGRRMRNTNGIGQQPVLAQFQRLRKESPFELCGFLNRYMRILLHVAGVCEHAGLARALKMHEDDLRYKPKEHYPWLRNGGVPYHANDKPHGPTGRIEYVAYDLSANPTVTPRYVKDIDAFNDQETLAEFLWAPVSDMRQYVLSRPGIIITEADAYVKIEPFQLEAFVWLREAVKRDNADCDVYENYPRSAVDTFEHFCDTVDAFRGKYGNRKILLNCSPLAMMVIGQWVTWLLNSERAITADQIEPFRLVHTSEGTLAWADLPSPPLDWKAINDWMRKRDITLFCPSDDEAAWTDNTEVELLGHAYAPLKSVGI